MKKFHYKAKNHFGQSFSGVLDAVSENAVQEMLQAKDWIVMRISEISPQDVRVQLKALTQHVSAKQIVIFSRQLAVLISANVPIVRALKVLSEQSTSTYFMSVVDDIANSVNGGMSLSMALNRYPRLFDGFFVSMVRAGETTGRLDEVLTYLADQKEKDYELWMHLMTALIYPAFIFFMLIVVFIVVMIFVIPKLLEIILSTGAPLPFMTRILLSISTLLRHYGILVIVGVVAFCVGLAFLQRRPKGKRFVDLCKLRIPFLRVIFTKIALHRISRSLGNLLASGVPINKALEICGEVVGNTIYAELLHTASKDVEAGKTISQSFMGNRYIPPMMTQMMVVGEEAGRLDAILSKIASFYEQDVQSLVRAMVNLIEPLVIVLLGIGTAILIMGVLMPIYTVTNTI